MIRSYLSHPLALSRDERERGTGFPYQPRLWMYTLRSRSVWFQQICLLAYEDRDILLCRRYSDHNYEKT